MGCLGVGLEAAGFKIRLKCDWNEKMLRLATNISPAPVLCKDICETSSIGQIVDQAPTAGTIAAGIACQPYSRLGDRKAQGDGRAMTLPAVLKLTFLGRFAIAILECVPEVMTCQWVQDTLKAFCRCTGFRSHQQVLDLHHVWPTRRTRWWCVLSHPSLGNIQWQPFPKVSPLPMVSNLFDQFLQCNDEDLRQLVLDLYELGKFTYYGVDTNLVPWKGQMKTCLHSCGNQLSGCPCGCRKYPFSEDRLSKGGLHRLLIQIPGMSQCGNNIYQNMRHIHPDELALLNGMFPGMPWKEPPRFTLCALGQLASPIQSCWVGAHIVCHLQSKFGESVQETPIDFLLDLMRDLLTKRDQVFGVQKGEDAVSFTNMVNQRKLDMASLNQQGESSVYLPPPSAKAPGTAPGVPIAHLTPAMNASEDIPDTCEIADHMRNASEDIPDTSETADHMRTHAPATNAGVPRFDQVFPERCITSENASPGNVHDMKPDPMHPPSHAPESNSGVLFASEHPTEPCQAPGPYPGVPSVLNQPQVPLQTHAPEPNSGVPFASEHPTEPCQAPGPYRGVPSVLNQPQVPLQTHANSGVPFASEHPTEPCQAPGPYPGVSSVLNQPPVPLQTHAPEPNSGVPFASEHPTEPCQAPGPYPGVPSVLNQPQVPLQTHAPEPTSGVPFASEHPTEPCQAPVYRQC